MPAFALIAAIISNLVAGIGQAATVEVRVRGADGRPLPGAVVTVSASQRAVGPIRFPWPYVMAQKDISFQPHILIVPVGATVSFPNQDKVRHHVYSFSKPKKFELKLYGQEEARKVVFDKPGVVAVGCNIHDRMSGYILVVDTPFAAQADAQGRVAFTGVVPGAVSIDVWDPSIRGRDNRLTQPVSVPPAGLSTIMSVSR